MRHCALWICGIYDFTLVDGINIAYGIMHKYGYTIPYVLCYKRKIIYFDAVKAIFQSHCVNFNYNPIRTVICFKHIYLTTIGKQFTTLRPSCELSFVVNSNSCQYPLIHISLLYFLIDPLWIGTGMCCLTWCDSIHCNLICSDLKDCAMSYRILQVCIGTYWFLSIPICRHCIVEQLYWFLVSIALLCSASYCHYVASYCIPLHHISSCLIRV